MHITALGKLGLHISDQKQRNVTREGAGGGGQKRAKKVSRII